MLNKITNLLLAEGSKTKKASMFTVFMGAFLTMPAVQQYVPPDYHAQIITMLGCIFFWLRSVTTGPMR